MKPSWEYIIQVIKPYGFIECGQILSFFTYVCQEHPDDADLLWVYRKVNQCLKNHNNGGEYFYDLERLQMIIEADFLDRS